MKNFKNCEECGKPFKPKSNRQRFCKLCSIENKREKCRIRKQKYDRKWGHRRRKIIGTRDFSMHRLDNHEAEAEAVHDELMAVNPKALRLPMRKVSKGF